jgi:hypothetical protein
MRRQPVNGMRERISRALATSVEESSTATALLKPGTSAVEFAAKFPLIQLRFKTEKNCWHLIDNDTEPNPALGVDPTITRETEFTEPEIDIELAVTDRLDAMRVQVNTAFRRELTAVPQAGNAAAGGNHWTAGHVANAKSKIKAQRARAILEVMLKEDDLRAVKVSDERARKARKKTFKEMQEACSKMFLEIFATEVLSPFLADLNEQRYRKVWRGIQSAFDGSLGGTDNTVNLVEEINNFVYCSDHSFDSNVQYLNHLCALVDYSDAFRLVCLLRAIDRATRVHKEIRETALIHKRLTSDYTTT